MGGTCTKILASNDPRTSKAIINNRVVSSLPSDNRHEGKPRNSEDNALDEKAHQFKSQDVLSKGDYNREDTTDTSKQPETKELCTTLTDQTVTLHDNLPTQNMSDDCNASLVRISAPTDSSPGHNDENGPLSDINGAQMIQIKGVDEPFQGVTNDCEILDDNSNSKTTTKEEKGTDHVSVKVINENACIKNGHLSQRNALVIEDVPEEVENTKINTSGPVTQEDRETEVDENEGTPAACPGIPLLMDKLYFYSLDEKEHRSQTPPRLPERLQNKTRKPTLMTYDERMLLADLNRFQQLDKRREFAVRRNKSISRNGKLPKIGGMKDVSPANSSNSLNGPDD